MTRVGVIGVGGWGKNHLRVLQEMGALACVSDTDSKRLELYSKKYRVNGYPGIDSMLREEHLDGVTICTPTETHSTLAAKALQSGVHTFVEKPLAYSSSEGEKIVGLADKIGVTLAVGYIERFNPAVSELARMLRQEELGDPLLLEFHRENRWPTTIRDVGIVLDTSVHDIDTARWLFGDEPNAVFARIGNSNSEHENFAAITMAFTRQRTAFIASNWVTPKRVRQLSAVCTEGVATVDFVSQQLRIDDEAGARIPRLEKNEPLVLELTNFVDAIEGKGDVLVQGRDALKTTRIAEAALESGRTGKVMS